MSEVEGEKGAGYKPGPRLSLVKSGRPKPREHSTPSLRHSWGHSPIHSLSSLSSPLLPFSLPPSIPLPSSSPSLPFSFPLPLPLSPLLSPSLPFPLPFPFCPSSPCSVVQFVDVVLRQSHIAQICLELSVQLQMTLNASNLPS